MKKLAILTLMVLVAARAYADSVTLEWRAPGDDDNVGTASAYVLKSSIVPLTEVNFAAGVTQPTPAPQIAGTMQNTVVTGLAPLTTYYFAIKAVDDVGNWSAISNVVRWTTGTVPIDSLSPGPPMGLRVVPSTAVDPSSVPITWMNPSEPFDGVGGERCFSLNPVDFKSANVWANAERTVLKLPGIPGRPDGGYIWCDVREPIRFRIRVRQGTRWSIPSNDIIAQRAVRWVEAGVDTEYFLRRAPLVFTDPRWSEGGFIHWALRPGDADPVSIVTEEYVNTLPPIQRFGCDHFGYWCLRGVRQVCPPQ